jgi:two-component system CheB/CheR fusion protein
MAARRTLFPIVGIGASAGGVEALEGFFHGLPHDTGCAFVIVTHLSPDRRSLLPEIVAGYTRMPVKTAEDGAPVRPNEVYILPADAVLEIEGGRLKVRQASAVRRVRKTVDVFFSALAKDQGEYAAGVVLSGGDGDGTLGVKAIKERGGFTLAQVGNGHGPQHPDMPNSAIASGMIDLAIPVEDMGQRLAEFARGFDMFDAMAEAEERADGDREAMERRQEICAILRNQVGHDFSGYKANTFLRRVQRRMQVNHLESLDAYIEQLRKDPKEVGALFRDLLINVTNFFRDPEAFKILEDQVVPKLFAGRGAEDSVRVWVPGCATGEEVFSIAMLLREHMDTLTATPRVQIFATDIDEPALAVARAGRYPEALLEGVSDQRRRRFFTHEDGSYVLAKAVRDLCVFSPHSVIRDPPFSRLDLISCRNLLIYFGPEAQNQVIPTFHYALRPGGHLFLGTSENLGPFAELFTPVDKKHRLFRSRGDAASVARAPLAISGLRMPAFVTPEHPAGRRQLAGIALRQATEAQVLERFAPAHVVVNRDGDVTYFSSRTGKYLEATAGAPTRQLLTLARKGLSLELRAVFREATESGRRATREGVVVEIEEDRVQRVDLSVEPLMEQGEERLFLVVFSDVGPQLSRKDAAHLPGPSEEGALQLERELRDTRERLQSLIEEYETALEELKSSNEELVSVNEELQSTNEELEASKEELQSLNEELHTVNGELTGKVEQLDRINSDLTNLFESTRVATIFLDPNLVIRSYTPAVSRIFNILPSDKGRPLTDLVGNIDLPDLERDVRSVFKTGGTIEQTLHQKDGAAHYLLRLAPYRDGAQKIEGVVLTLVDVTSLTRAEQHQKVLIAELNHRVKNMLAVVISVAEQTYKTAGSDSREFMDRFVGRVRGMARSYELLTRENWTEALIEDLARPHLEPFGPERYSIDGPKLALNPRQALSVGMIIHELATNASKYGALGAPHGHVDLSWREEPRQDGAELELLWRERNGPKVAQPERLGFGLKLVQRETASSLKGQAAVDFEPEGLKVRIAFARAGPEDPV